MKVSIVTEGFKSTGYGHVTRCLSLYQAFEEKKIEPILLINGDENLKSYIDGTNYKIIDWLTYPTKLLPEIKNTDILIIDSYLAGKDYYENFARMSKVNLFIDDYLRLDYPRGIILNGTINAETFPYQKKPGSDYLLGVKYIPIRKEFWAPAQRKINQSLHSILITFGAQDVKNITVPVVKAVRENFPDLKLLVVIGNNSSENGAFEKLKDGKTEIHYSVNAARMRQLMLSADVAISAAGQTLYELAVTGTPTIAVAVAENQRSNILEWKKSGAILDPIFQSDQNYLRKIIEQLAVLKSVSLRKKLSSAAKDKVDGLGSRRAINFAIEKFCEANQFYLRRATPEDSRMVYELSNDPTVRAQSINKSAIEWASHEKWFALRIKEKNYIFLLAFNKNDSFIGQVRFDVSGGNATVSISIKNKFRGKGFSKKILSEACSRVLGEIPELNTITAYILPSNIPSINGFRSSGFVYAGEEKINDETFLKFILSR